MRFDGSVAHKLDGPFLALRAFEREQRGPTQGKLLSEENMMFACVAARTFVQLFFFSLGLYANAICAAFFIIAC